MKKQRLTDELIEEIQMIAMELNYSNKYGITLEDFEKKADFDYIAENIMLSPEFMSYYSHKLNKKLIKEFQFVPK